MPTDVSGLRAAVGEWASRVHDGALEDLSRTLYDAAPVRDGTLRASLEQTGGRDDGLQVVGQIEFGADHASFTDEGTEPHDIVGNPLLAFEVDGHTVIVHSVHHPGTTGTHWWADNATDDGWLAACERAAAGVEVDV